MDLKEKVLGYKDEVVKEIQNAIRVKKVGGTITWNAFLGKVLQKHYEITFMGFS